MGQKVKYAEPELGTTIVSPKIRTSFKTPLFYLTLPNTNLRDGIRMRMFCRFQYLHCACAVDNGCSDVRTLVNVRNFNNEESRLTTPEFPSAVVPIGASL